MRSRFVSAFIAFLLILVVLWVGLPLMLPVLLFAGWLGVREYVGMVRGADIDVRRKALLLFSVLIIVASYPNLPEVPWIGGSWREVVLTAALFYLLILEVVRPGERPLERIVYSGFGLLYVPWLLGYFLQLRATPNLEDGFGYLLLPLMAAFATDVGGFFFGKLFGRRKLAPEVSPAKTVEGAMGGLVFSFVMVFLVGRVLEGFLFNLNVYDALLYSLMVSSAAQLGDLAESIIKRSLGAKDSGQFLPGHGGILDRLDSLLFAVPISYFFVTIVAGR
nr:phosphatidate cytidylyltransferase [Deinobacterium chartae]